MDDEVVKKVRQKTLTILLYRDRTEKELRDKLAKLGFEQSYIDDGVEYARGYHYIDDERYARNYIEVAKRTKSMKKIMLDLKNRGIGDELRSLMKEEYDGDDEAFQYCLQKKLQGRAIEELDEKERQKVMAFLMRKGFNPSRIYRIFR